MCHGLARVRAGGGAWIMMRRAYTTTAPTKRADYFLVFAAGECGQSGSQLGWVSSRVTEKQGLFGRSQVRARCSALLGPWPNFRLQHRQRRAYRCAQHPPHVLARSTLPMLPSRRRSGRARSALDATPKFSDIFGTELKRLLIDTAGDGLRELQVDTSFCC